MEETICVKGPGSCLEEWNAGLLKGAQPWTLDDIRDRKFVTCSVRAVMEHYPSELPYRLGGESKKL